MVTPVIQALKRQRQEDPYNFKHHLFYKSKSNVVRPSLNRFPKYIMKTTTSTKYK